MKNLNFTVPNTRQEAKGANNLQESNLVGLDAFMSKPLEIKNSTELVCYLTMGQNALPVRSDCSYYCPTSTCAQCC